MAQTPPPEPADADEPDLGEASRPPAPGGGDRAEASGGSVRLSGSSTGVPAQPSAWRNKRLGKFRLLSILGQGAMGRVFLAEDTALHRQVAVKVLKLARDAPGGDRKAARRNEQFLREARAAAALSHPHVVNVLEIGERRGVVFIAMDLVGGGDVKRLIDTGGALSIGRACDLAADAAEGLAFAHEMGVVHRDVKPANLMITRQGRVKLADFGLADAGDPNDTHRLRDGVIGTPACMAPEVAMGNRATAASDQYSLGCTLWHMLTGEPIFAGESFQHVLEKQARAVPPSLAEKVPGIPPSLAEAVERSLAKDPAGRHASCEAFGRILRGHAVALGPAGVSNGGSGTVVVQAVPAGRGLPAAWAIGIGAAAAAVVAAVLVVQVTRDRGAEQPPPVDGPVAQAPAQAPAPAPAPAPTPVSTPPPAAPAPPPEPGPPTPAPPASLSPGSAPRLALAAANGEWVAVAGRIASVSRSGTDGRQTARFADAGGDGLVLFWDKPLDARLGRAFGGPAGEGLANRGVVARGVPEFRYGLPALRLSGPDDVVVEP